MNAQWAEEQEHGRDVAYWVVGVPCATHREACLIAGADTPEDIAAEQAYYATLERDAALDSTEVSGPKFRAYRTVDDWI